MTQRYNSDGYDDLGYGRDGFNLYGYDKEGYNREGFNREGYNRYGFCKMGHDRQGYDAEGFNRHGVDRLNYDREGYNIYSNLSRDGYDSAGYDSEGYDRQGYDRNGLNRVGFDRQGNSYRGVQKDKPFPLVVTLCGSTRFYDEFQEANRRLTLEGKIVLTVGVYGHQGDELSVETKEGLDELHKRKIDLSDAIFVVNPGGYVGESTKSEIKYALSQSKPVRYLEEENK